MIFLQVFLAILASFMVVRFFVWRRFRRGHGFGMRPGMRGRGGWRFFRLYRELGLSREQKGELRDLGRSLRDNVGDLRGELPSELARILGAEAFDRITAERLADERVARLVRVKDLAIDVLERAHAVLTPDQRARVAAAF